MSQIIFLNGCSSAGKTTLVKALQHLSKPPLLTFGVDALIEAMPPEYVGTRSMASQGFQFVMTQDKEGPITKVVEGPFGKAVAQTLPKIIRVLGDCGHDVIVDEVLLDKKNLQDYVAALCEHTVYFIGVFCDLPTMLEREILRGNRALGLARDQLNRVHVPEGQYDMTLDTTHLSPFDGAQKILHFISKTPNPQAFKNFQK